jgi:hypothetical protein
MSGHSKALRNYKTGNALHGSGLAVAIPGALGFGLVLWLNTGDDAKPSDFEVIIGLGGAACLFTGFLFYLVGNQMIKKSVRLYNSSRMFPIEVNFGLTPTGGVGFVMRF